MRDIREDRMLGTRRRLLLGIALAGLLAMLLLRLSPAGLIPGAGGLKLAGEFLGGALRPALGYEAGFVPEGAPPFLLQVLQAAGKTVQIAAAAVGLSLILGCILGLFAACPVWGCGDGEPRSPFCLPCLICKAARVFISVLRSVHELLWAVLFLAALGRSEVVAVIAISLPYAGTFAKIFAEMVEESPTAASDVFRRTGASPLSAFAFGLVPRAVPDMLAYGFYRFECALRSSAVLGFLGIPTLGYFLKLSFKSSHHGEVWTYLYALIIMVVVLDLWSRAIRRRLVR